MVPANIMLAKTVVNGSNTMLAANTPAASQPAVHGENGLRPWSSHTSRLRGDDGSTSTATDKASAAAVGPVMAVLGFARAGARRRPRRSARDRRATP